MPLLPAVIHTASSGKVPALPYWLTPIGGGEGGFGVDSVLVRTYATPMVPPYAWYLKSMWWIIIPWLVQKAPLKPMVNWSPVTLGLDVSV